MNNEENWLIAVTAGKWQRQGIREARALGLKVLAIDSDPHAEGFIDADKKIVSSFVDYTKVIDAVRNTGLNIRGAVSFCSEVGMELASIINQELGLPGLRPELCQRLVDKALQRKIWTENNIPGPRWEVYNDIDKAIAAIDIFGFPLVVKPSDSSGSRGVTILESSQEDINGALNRAYQYSRNGNILIESYMNGTEYTVETFGCNGKIHVLAVTEKKKIEGTRGTVAYELATPDISDEIVMQITDVVKDSYIALGYMEGPGHAEVILKDDDSVGMVEVAGRGGGFMVFDRFVPKVSGVNLPRLTILHAIGEDIGGIVITEKAAVLRFIPTRPGLLKSISGIEVANALTGVDADTFVQVGATFVAAETDADRLGYILSCANTPSLAQEIANEAELLIHFEIG